MSERTEHDELTEIFSQALELEPDEREKFLDEACQNKLHQRKRIESLLKSFEKSEDFIEKPVIQVSQIQPEKQTEAESDLPFQIFSPKLLRGDLDNIILTALRKEPSRRYLSVEDLSKDISNYLNDLPVSARPSTLRYRLEKYFYRHKLRFFAASFFLISLLAGLAVLLYQNNLTYQAKVTAEREAVKSKKITKFMETILSYANPAWYAEGSKSNGEAKLIDVIDDLSGKIEAEFPDDLDVQAELHHKLAETYLQKQFLQKALFHAEKALELRRRVFGEKNAEVAKDLYYLSSSKFANHEIIKSIQLSNQAIQMFYEVAPDNPNLPYLLEDNGENYFRYYDDLEIVEEYLTKALEIFRRTDGDNHFNTARILMELSELYAQKGDLAQSAEFEREGQARFRQLTNEFQRNSCIVYEARILIAKGDFTQAQAILENRYNELLKNNEDATPFGNIIRGNLVKLYINIDNFERAIEIKKNALGIENRRPIPNVSQVEEINAEIAYYYLRLGKPEQAKPYFEVAFNSFKDSSADHNFFIEAYLGRCLFYLKRYAEAEPLLQTALANYPPLKEYRDIGEMLDKINKSEQRNIK